MEEQENKNFLSSPVTWIVLVIVLLCCCAVAIGLIGFSYFSINNVSPIFDMTGTPDVNLPTSTPAAPAELTRVPVDQIPTDTLSTLEDTIVPVNDLRDLACRL